MRAPFQILVIPFRQTVNGPEFAVLKRSDAGGWQFVAGGGEEHEFPRQAAARETTEEIGIAVDGFLFPLDSVFTVPRNCFAAADSWGPDIFVIPEYCFAVDVGDRRLTLSGEHVELQWLPYAQASALLKWDSNRSALWELRNYLKTPAGAGDDTTAERRPIE